LNWQWETELQLLNGWQQKHVPRHRRTVAQRNPLTRDVGALTGNIETLTADGDGLTFNIGALTFDVGGLTFDVLGRQSSDNGLICRTFRNNQ